MSFASYGWPVIIESSEVGAPVQDGLRSSSKPSQLGFSIGAATIRPRLDLLTRCAAAEDHRLIMGTASAMPNEAAFFVPLIRTENLRALQSSSPAVEPVLR